VYVVNDVQSRLAWFRALADADMRPVPALHNTSVDRLNGPGARAYPATAVVTTSPTHSHITLTLHSTVSDSAST